MTVNLAPDYFPDYLPRPPSVWFEVKTLLDMRSDPRWRSYQWASATDCDGYLTSWPDVIECVGECIASGLANCHLRFSLRVYRMEAGGKCEDVTAQALEHFDEDGNRVSLGILEVM
jgi:hypothetical protein